METFKPIEGWSWYEISNLGNVRSVWSQRFRKSSIHKHGYMNVRLCSEGGEQRGFYVHRLVAKAFIPNPLNLPDVDHIDGNPRNNCVQNLRWVTHRQNILLAIARRGGRHWISGIRRAGSRYVAVKCDQPVMCFKSLASACAFFNKKYKTFAPVINKAVKNNWSAYGYEWKRLRKNTA